MFLKNLLPHNFRTTVNAGNGGPSAWEQSLTEGPLLLAVKNITLRNVTQSLGLLWNYLCNGQRM